MLSDAPSLSLMGAYLNFAKFHNLASYKAQILGAIEGNIYRIENIVRNH